MDYTKNSADADKPAQRVYRSVKVAKHGTIRYVTVTYSFLSVCYSKFVPKTLSYSTCNYSDLETRVMGHPRW